MYGFKVRAARTGPDYAAMGVSVGDLSSDVEVDHMDSERRTGWSVLLRGELEEIPPDALPAIEGSIQPWGPDHKDRWMWVKATPR